MNLSTIALVLLAWQLLSNSPNKEHAPRPNLGLTDFLNDDTKNMLNCVDKLSSSSCSQEDKTSALFQMMANPAVMNLAGNLFGGNRQSENPQSNGASATASNATPAHQHTPPTQDEHVNAEGYRFETPSASSQQFFHEIDNIADAEIKHKLYWFYDNWYVK